MRINYKLSKRGSFLLEVLLSITILSISLVAIIQAMSSTLRISLYSSESYVALISLDNKLVESIRAKMFSGTPVDNLPLAENDWQEKYKVEVGAGSSSIDLPGIEVFEGNVSWKSSWKDNKINLAAYLFEKSTEKLSENPSEQ